MIYLRKTSYEKDERDTLTSGNEHSEGPYKAFLRKHNLGHSVGDRDTSIQGEIPEVRGTSHECNGIVWVT